MEHMIISGGPKTYGGKKGGQKPVASVVCCQFELPQGRKGKTRVGEEKDHQTAGKTVGYGHF